MKRTDPGDSFEASHPAAETSRRKERRNSGTEGLWELIPADEWVRPGHSADRAAQSLGRRLVSFLHSFWKLPQDQVPPSRQQWNAAETAEELVPAVNWDEVKDSVLGAGVGGAGERVAFVVPPGCGLSEALLCIAQQRDANFMPPCSRRGPLADIIRHGREILGSRERDASEGGPLIIPHAERLFLRTASGLEAQRRWYEQLWQLQRPVWLGINSWAWAFLNHTLKIGSSFDLCLTLIPWDGERLERWLRDQGRWVDNQVLCARQRTPVLGSSHAVEGSSATPDRPISSLLRDYAAAAQGNPGVALALLRRGLQREDLPDKTGQFLLHSPPARDLAWIERSPESTALEMVLHNLLLHDGLPESELAAVLPFAPEVVRHALRQLAARGILQLLDDIWRVGLADLPGARNMLGRDGYLTDSF